MFTAFGTVISWKASLQKVVALSTTGTEYIALIEDVKESLWLEGIAKELKIQNEVITVHCDSQSAIDLPKIMCIMREQSTLILSCILLEKLLVQDQL